LATALSCLDQLTDIDPGKCKAVDGKHKTALLEPPHKHMAKDGGTHITCQLMSAETSFFSRVPIAQLMFSNPQS